MFLGVKHQHRQRGIHRVESAIEERSMSSENKQLVEFIRQGIGSRSQNAECCTPWSPKAPALFAGTTVKKKGEDAIFNYMGWLAERGMKKSERVR